MQAAFENGTLTLCLTGHVDAANASALEADIQKAREEYQPGAVVLDCDKLEYMSSAGLRVLLRLRQKVPDTSLVNVHAELYEILDMTGFTEMMPVKKAYRVVSLEGCELIGQGANGKVYRLDRENILKVYTNTDALPEIQHERELSRAAFVLGVPTAIPYDVVQVAEGGFGSVYELLNARTYVQLYQAGEKSLDELADMSVELLKLIHTRVVRQDFVPSIRSSALGWAEDLKKQLTAASYEKLRALIGAVPEDAHMVHGDYHFRNIMYQNGESLLIDMDKLSHGHPVFEFAAIYNAYCGFGLLDRSTVENFIGLPFETTAALWRKLLSRYLETEDEALLRSVEDKAKVVGYARLLRHVLRRNGMATEAGRRQIETCRAALEELLARTDTLLF